MLHKGKEKEGEKAQKNGKQKGKEDPISDILYIDDGTTKSELFGTMKKSRV